MEPTEAPGQDASQDGLYELSKYPSTIVHRGALPESWFPEWLFRRHRRRKQLGST